MGEAEIAGIVDAAWAELADIYGVSRDDPATWVQPGKNLKRPRTIPRTDDDGPPRLAAALDDLMGEGEWEMHGAHDWGMMMFTFPNVKPDKRWFLPLKTWHWDTPVTPHLDFFDGRPPFSKIAGTHLFPLLKAHEPGGGATLFIEGMHRFILRSWASWSPQERAAKQAAQRARIMASHPWLKDLHLGCDLHGTTRIAHFMDRDEIVPASFFGDDVDSGDVDGEGDITLRVHEMTGAPGDIYILHPLITHTGAPNGADTPRIMRSKMALRKDFDWE